VSAALWCNHVPAIANLIVSISSDQDIRQIERPVQEELG
jgi:hypothetical protein